MTKSAVITRCRWCGRAIDLSGGPGRPKVFCKASCRQADYVARRRRIELGLGESELVIARQALDELRDALYVLEAAVEDVDRDLDQASSEQDLRDALAWLLAAARSVCGAADVT